MRSNFLYKWRFGFFLIIGMKKVWIANPCESAAASSGKCLLIGTSFFYPSGAIMDMYTKNRQYPIVEMMPYANKLAPK